MQYQVLSLTIIDRNNREHKREIKIKINVITVVALDRDYIKEFK